MKYWSEAQEASLTSWTPAQRKMIDLTAEACVNVMGWENWNRLTDKEKHDAVMMLLKDFSARLDMIA